MHQLAGVALLHLACCLCILFVHTMLRLYVMPMLAMSHDALEGTPDILATGLLY